MTMTLGQVVTELYELFERRYGDRQLAARATQVIVNDLLCRKRERQALRLERRVPRRGTAQRVPLRKTAQAA
jgi:hypothetical protein